MLLRKLYTPLTIVGLLATFAYSEYVVKPHYHDHKIHIVYWEKWTGGEGDAIKQTVNYFNHSQNKIHVDLLTISDIQDKTLLSVAGGDPPDVAGLYGADVAQYADDRAVIDLDPYLRKYGIKKSQYIPVYWKMNNIRGKEYALPSTPASTALFYNRALFKAAGMDPDKPRDWHHGHYTIEEMDKDAARLTKFAPNGQLQIMGFLPAEPGWWEWGWGYFFGGKLWNGSNKITANDAGNIKAYQWIASFSKKYGANNVSAFHSGLGQFSSSQNGFMAGKVAMEIQGVWFYHYIAMYAPNMLANPKTGKQAEWGIAPFPYPADRPDRAGTTFADEDVLVIPRGAKHPNSAFKFIDFMESPKGMDMLCGLQWKMSPLIHNEPGFYRNNRNRTARFFAEQAESKNVINVPRTGIYPEYADALQNAYDAVSLLDQTPKQALDVVQRQIQRQLNEYIQHEKMRLAAEGKSHK